MPPGPRRGDDAIVERLRSGIEGLHPAYFALVMATGIVSLACHRFGLADGARLLFWLNLPAYGVLWAATLLRALLFPRRLARDLACHQRGPGFFTTVAATAVVGAQLALLRDDPDTAALLWWLALALWAACTYGVFVLLGVRRDKPSLAQGIHGGWLVAVVATQSLCVLGCAVLPAHMAHRDAALLALTCFWLCGGMLYVWMISLIFQRYMFFAFAPSDLMPPYWINMGAMAISTLAGAMLLGVAQPSPALAAIRPFVMGFTLLYWATATWWIPMLVILGVWRHGLRRVRLAYDPLYWGLVFPLGMYAVATLALFDLVGVRALLWLARGFVVAALVAWLLTFLGMAARLLGTLVLALRALRAWVPRLIERQTAGGGTR